MASYGAYMSVQEKKKKKESDDAKALAAKDTPLTSADASRRGQIGSAGEEGDKARADAARAAAAGPANLQAREGSKGAYGGLSLGERGQAERLAKEKGISREEAAAQIRDKKKPKAATQAGALSTP